MREELLRQAEAELENRRMKNEEADRQRTERIRREAPEIAALADERQEMIYGSLRGILAGQKTAEDLPEKMAAVNARIREALRKRGWPENALEPAYGCLKCRDTGYVGERVKEPCECLLRIYQEKLRAEIGLAGNDRETFENYDETLFPAEPEEGQSLSQRTMNALVRGACERWADSWPNQKPRDMVLSGKSGVGKTFFLHAMATRLISRGCGVLLISAYSFLDIARRCFLDPEDGGMKELIDAEVLMLDDLGSEPLMRNVTIEQLFTLINVRQRRNRATVISTNLNEEELRERYTERIISRLTDRGQSEFIPMIGRDVRTGRN